MKLGKIAEIRTGLVLTRKRANIKYEIEESHKLISLKNIENDGTFNEEPFETFESNDDLDEQYFTQEGDILIRLSCPYTATYIDKEQAGLLVPSCFAIIRLITKKFIAPYIAWYLNSSEVKKELIRNQTGTMIPVTNKKILNSLNIKELSLDRQKNIAKIQKLYWREKHLLSQLMKNKEKFYKGITNKLIEMK